jgi:hypothetical protein
MIVNDYFNNIEGLKMGVITFESTLDFTDDKQTIIDFIRGIQYTGLNRYNLASNNEAKIMVDSYELSWKIEAKTKNIVLLCDCMRFNYNNYSDIREITNKFKRRNINIYFIAALYRGDSSSFQLYNTFCAYNDNNYFILLFQLHMINDYLKAIGLKIAGKTAELGVIKKEHLLKYGNKNVSLGFLYNIIMSKITKDDFYKKICPNTFKHLYGDNKYLDLDNLDEHKYKKEELTLDILIHSGLVEKPTNENEFMELRKKYYNISATEYEEYKKKEKKKLYEFIPFECLMMKYQLVEVEEDCILSDFCKKYYIKPKKGKLFSEVKKKENINPDKDLVVYDKKTGEFNENVRSRIILKLSDTVNKEKCNPTLFPNYRIFIECAGRKILNKDDTVLYRF